MSMADPSEGFLSRIVRLGELHGDDVCIRYLDESGARADEITYAGILDGARRVAATLRSEGAAGAPVVVLTGATRSFAVWLVGCMLAGSAVVPAPRPRASRQRDRLQRLVHDSGAAVIIGKSSAEPNGVPGARWLESDCYLGAEPSHAVIESHPPDRTAVLQYTSGSTATPRGVLLSYGSLGHNIRQIASAYDLSPESRAVIWLPTHHDMGLIGGLLTPLSTGFPVTLLETRHFAQQPIAWLRAMSRERGTVSGGPNGAYDLVARELEKLPADGQDLDLSEWRTAFVGAEPIHPETMRRFLKAVAPLGFRAEAILPCYGLAEATLMVTSTRSGGLVTTKRPADGIETVNCGPPVDDTEVVIVDNTGAALPPGQIGRILVQGPGVASGYLSNTDESQRVFGAVVSGRGGTFLDTGDLGFCDIAGNLFPTGRVKDVLILLGRNVYPSDLENAAAAAAGSHLAGSAAVFGLAAMDEFAVAVECLVDEGEYATVLARIRSTVAAEAQHAPVVAALVYPGSIPRTTSGKIQHGQARDDYLSGRLAPFAESDTRLSRSAPSKRERLLRDELPGATHARRVEMLTEYLQDRLVAVGVEIQNRSADSSLSSHGLDSLTQLSILNGLEAAVGTPLSRGKFLSLPSVVAVAEAASDAISTARADVTDTVVATEFDTWDAASPSEAAMYVLESLQPGGTNLWSAWEVTGPCDAHLVKIALTALSDRHEALRTEYRESPDGVLRRVRPPATCPPAVATMDAGNWSKPLTENWIRQATRAPFDLSAAPLVRGHVLQLGDGEHLLLVTASHLVTDFRSTTLLFDELLAELVRPGSGPSAPSRYTDHVSAVRAYLDSDDGRAAVADCAHDLDAVRSQLSLTTATGANQLQAGEAMELPLVLSAGKVDALIALAHEEQTTLFVALLAVFQATLHHCTQQSELVVGTPVFGRTQQFGSTVGLFMNQAPIISRLTNSDTFRQLMGETRSRVFAALDRELCPLAAVTAAMSHDNSAFEAMFVLHQPAHRLSLGELVDGVCTDVGDLTFRTRYVPRTLDTLPLTLVGAQYDDTVRFVLRYLCQQIPEDTAHQVASTFVTLAERLVANPDIPVLLVEPTQVDQLVSSGARATTPRPESIVARLRRVVMTYPDVVAVDDSATTHTYEELWDRSGRIAGHLVAHGVRAPETVMILCRRNAAAVLATIAVLRSGATYVHLDADSPSERLRHIARDSGARLLLTERQLVHIVTDLDMQVLELDDLRIGAATDCPPAVHPEQVAYVSYTSGSSGRPKGVVVTHRAVVAAADAYGNQLAVGPGDVVCGVSPLGWDIVVGDIYAALLRGATLALTSEDLAVDPTDLVAFLYQRRVSVLATTPHRWKLLLTAGFDPSPGFRAVSGGDVMPPALVADFQRRGVHVWNFYGPTETVLWATYSDLWSWGGETATATPIGSALDGYQIHVVNPMLQHVPDGTPGELCIGGPTVADGYLNMASQTAERFVPDPFCSTPGARLYRTGDIVRRGPDGLTFQGRADLQFKVRGYRVEAADIESALMTVGSVHAAATTLVDGELVAFVQAAKGEPFDPEDLLRALRSKLPGYMVPGRVIQIDELPINANAKVDRTRLAAMVPEGIQPSRVVGHGPTTPNEKLVADSFREVLGVEVDLHDDFFAIGGHSLRAVQVAARLTHALGDKISVRTVFAHRTVSGIADQLDRTTIDDGAAVYDRAEHLTARPGALSSGQYRVWYEQLVARGDVGLVLPFAVELNGRVVPEIAQQAFDLVVDRHESLRTIVVADLGEPSLRFGPRPVLTTAQATGGLHADARKALASLVAAPWHVDEGPLIRGELRVVNDDCAVLLVVLHHLISDGWSARVLLTELLNVYADLAGGRQPELPSLPMGEHAAASSRAVAGDGITAEAVCRVAERLRGMKRLVFPPVDVQMTDDVARKYTFDAGTSIHRIARRRRMTTVGVVAAALGITLARRCGNPDLVIWLDVANRNHQDLDHLVGYFGNQIPIRVNFGDGEVDSVLDRVGDSLVEALADADAPYEQVLAELRRLSGNSVTGDHVDVKLVHQFMPQQIASDDGSITGTIMDSGWASAANPLGLWVWDDGERCRLEMHHQATSCPTEWAEALLVEVVATIRTEIGMEPPTQPSFGSVEVVALNPAKDIPRSVEITVDRTHVTTVLTVTGDDVTEAHTWLSANRAVVVDGLTTHGAVLVRGFNVNTPESLSTVTGALYDERYATSEHPRQVIAGQVVTPVEYPMELELLWHNEDSFNRVWPATLAFACARAAEQGGETTVVDGIRVLERLPADVRAKFEHEGVRYVRRFIPGLGLPWTTVFGTEDRAEVARRCVADGIDWTWDGDLLTTAARRPAVITVGDEQAWFAQILHWHEACIDPDTREEMRAGLNAGMPRSVTFGDGSPISEGLVDELVEICRATEYPVHWQVGDVLFVNNRRAAHGRRAYRGERRLLVALGDPVSD